MELDKKLLDEVIRLLRKYKKSHDIDIHSLALKKSQFVDRIYWIEIVHVIDFAIQLNSTNKKIYEVLNVLGFEVVENVD